MSLTLKYAHHICTRSGMFRKISTYPVDSARTQRTFVVRPTPQKSPSTRLATSDHAKMWSVVPTPQRRKRRYCHTRCQRH